MLVPIGQNRNIRLHQRKQLRQFAPRGLGDGGQASRASRKARQEGAIGLPKEPTVALRAAEDIHVVDAYNLLGCGQRADITKAEDRTSSAEGQLALLPDIARGDRG